MTKKPVEYLNSSMEGKGKVP